MSFVTDRADLVEQLAAALDLAVEAHVEAGRLLGVAHVLARRLADLRVEAVESTNSDEVNDMEEVNETEESIAAEGTAPAEVPPERRSPPKLSFKVGVELLELAAPLSPEELKTAFAIGVRTVLDMKAAKATEAAAPAAGGLMEAAE